MGKDRDRDTPVTGRAIPRPRVVELGTREIEVTPPETPRSLEDLYRLIDERLSPAIIERISSAPPPAESAKPRQSISVRAAKGAGRWTKWAMAVLGVLTIVGEIWADVEKYRGPISQLLIIAAKQLDAHEAPELAPPELPAGE